VAEKIAELATAESVPAVSEIAGPREESMVEAATLLASRRGDPKRIEPWSDPSNPDAALYEGGAALPGPGATLAGPTFEEWLGAAA
jgi:hypothetical protein